MQRVLLKLSGEYLQAGAEVCASQHLQNIQEQVAQLRRHNFEIGIVIGGGNIFRGGKHTLGVDIDRCLADSIGMAATLVNALMLQAYFLTNGLPTKVYGAQALDSQVPVFQIENVRQDIKTHVIIFAGGTGHPFFSTDTAAALRAIEIQAKLLLKATKVDGVYDKDPKKYDDAKRFDLLTYHEALAKQYRVMDACAFALCMEHKLPIFIFNIFEKDAIMKAINKQIKGTLITA
ncbi:MAG: UMP kinase [Puniceicoccales bacterium]|jgi:uridylate kinase|nr:UMP kinase [Puniceicoccales bacterium]